MKISLAKLREFFLSDKGRKILIVCAAAIMILLLFGSVFGGKENSAPVQAENTAEIEKALEKRLCELISEIDGTGEVSVMVTLESTSAAVYEKDRKLMETSGGSSKETEVVLAGSSKQPLKVGTVMPTVRGAAVVCKGADDPVIREKISNVVARALNIGISKVYVTG